MGIRGRRVGVTASEMLELRNQGYSNEDIANMLEISKTTVFRYIGSQGGRMERCAAFIDKPKKKASEAAAEAAPIIASYTPRAVTEEYMLGCADTEDVMFAKINYDSKKLIVSTLHGEVSLTYEQARELVQFLAWASRERIKPEEGKA